MRDASVNDLLAVIKCLAKVAEGKVYFDSQGKVLVNCVRNDMKTQV